MFVMAVFFVAFGMAYEFACSLTAVILHELAHASVAKRFGYALNEIRLMPYGAALCGKADMRPAHEAIIAAAGPAFNLALGMIFAAMWWLVPSSYIFTEIFCKCNLYIGLFNLLPVYPLDGGRALLALLCVKIKRKKAYTAMRVLSAVFGIAAIALFVLSALYAPNICFLSVGLFMLASAFIPDARAEYYALFAFGSRRERINKPLEIKAYAVGQNAALPELVKSLDPDRLSEFYVYDEGLNRCGSIDETSLVEFVKVHGYDSTVGDVVAQQATGVKARGE